MALKDRAAEAAKTQETPVVENVAPVEEVKTETKTVTVKEETSTEVAVQTPNASVFISYPPLVDAATGYSYGDFPAIVASNGNHTVGGDTSEELGKVIKFQVILTQPVKKLTPGSNDEEAKEYFQVSDDCETVRDGRSLEEALQEALDAGYSKAAIKDYLDVVALITECDIEEYIGEIVVLQLAPSSMYNWRPLAKRIQTRAAMGRLTAQPVLGNAEQYGSAVEFISTAKPENKNGNKYTVFSFTV